MRLLGIDAGFHLGFACVEPGKPPISGSVEILGSSQQIGLMAVKFAAAMRKLIDEHKPDGIVMCPPHVRIIRTGKFTTVDVKPIRVLFGMFAVGAAVAESLRIPFYEPPESEARKAIIGFVPRKSEDIKAAVIAACQQRQWYVCDDHAGDAVIAAVYQLGKLVRGSAHRTDPLFIVAAKAKPKPAQKRKLNKNACKA